MLLELLPVGIITYDKNDNVIFSNKIAEEILQISGWSLSQISVNQSLDIPVGDKIYVANRVDIHEGDTGYVILLTDISNWHNKINEQKEQIDELEDIFNSSYDEIFVIDGSGQTKRINKVGESYYGVPVKTLLGQNVNDLEKSGFFNQSVARIVLQDKKRVTMTQTTKSGKQLIVTGNPIFNENGDITRVVVNSRDISELLNLRKQLENTEQLVESYRQQLLKLSQEKARSSELIAESPQMKRVLEMVDKVAQVDSTVLITGESGVGKGMLASRLHKLSKRSDGPFITINCGAIPENLLESELFGYEGGAFTGARKEGKKGLLELASGGTVFLDEITELPLGLQVKLLQVIHEKKLIRIGGSKYVEVNIRFVAATNRDIRRMVNEGLFREDLYYRLNVIPIVIPPLRYRQEDIPALVDYFFEKLNSKYQTNKRFTSEALDILKSYNWPGNVRELENLVERLLVTKEDNEIGVAQLPDYIFEGKSRFPNRIYVLDIYPLKEATEELEKQLIVMAHSRYKNTYKMAKALEINQSTVVRKLQKYQLGSSPRPAPVKAGKKK